MKESRKMLSVTIAARGLVCRVPLEWKMIPPPCQSSVPEGVSFMESRCLWGSTEQLTASLMHLKPWKRPVASSFIS